MGKHVYLVAKGGSLDNVTSDWFDDSSPVWCLNQSATVIRRLLPDREVHCIQNDDWIKYTPPADVTWHCHLRVPVGNHPHVERYRPEFLTGNWADPTCMSALQLMYNAGYDDITMIGFDSHFDKSKNYANVIGVKSKEDSPFNFYDTMMRRWALKKGVTLNWVDANGVAHPDDFKFRHCILGVAIGERYERQTDRMIDSFLKHNPDWTAERVYGDRLVDMLPKECKRYSDFDKCEIGRWVAMRNLLQEYDTVLYCDGDIRWFHPYSTHPDLSMVLCPHYVTLKVMQSKKHQLFWDGVANIGIVEVNRSTETEGKYENARGIFDHIINEVIRDPSRFRRHDKLWLQPLVSSVVDVGYNVAYNDDPGMDLASWNLRHGDRYVFEEEGELYAKTYTGLASYLKSVHFSSKSLDILASTSKLMERLVKEYRNEK